MTVYQNLILGKNKVFKLKFCILLKILSEKKEVEQIFISGFKILLETVKFLLKLILKFFFLGGGGGTVLIAFISHYLISLLVNFTIYIIDIST